MKDTTAVRELYRKCASIEAGGAGASTEDERIMLIDVLDAANTLPLKTNMLLRLDAAGYRQQQIAAKLGVSLRTVQRQLPAAWHRLGRILRHRGIV